MSSPLPEGWRPLRSEDAQAVAEVLAANAAAYGYPALTSADDVSSYWRRTDLARNSWGRDEGGRLLAGGWLEAHGGAVIAGGEVHPEVKGRGLGAALVDISELRAREIGAGTLWQVALGADDAARRLLEARGYREARRHYEMAIRLDAEAPEPALAEGLLLDSFRERDAEAFHAAMGEAFADEWGFPALSFDEWWRLRKDDDQSLWFVVRDGGEIAACERCEPMHGGGFVGMLGVRKPWRRRGLGRALLLHAFREFRGRGFERASLGVDSENPTGATRLYESVGMTVESEQVTFEKGLA